MQNKYVFVMALSALPFSWADAAPEGSVYNLQTPALEETYITGSADDLRTIAGAAKVLDQETIAQFDASNVNNLVSQVPGVYIRYEDGYGLRPNIGIRGVTSDRSQKITLMEDGILISPSPYSAPAAYYFPNVNRLQAVELVKGPAAIQHGPHTIGGALNMVTRAVPDAHTGEFDLSLGSDGFRKARVFYGNSYQHSDDQFGFAIDGLRYQADGFKELDGGGDTGFVRNDLNAKVQWQRDTEKRAQSLIIKLGYADEDADETYLGLTDEDFAENPNRRYIASQLDRFQSEHQQLHILYSVDFKNNLIMHAKAYTQTFDRSWNKFDGFIPDTTFVAADAYDQALPTQAVLTDEDIFPEYIALLRGERNSNGQASFLIDITDNDRSYGSQGLEVNAEYEWQWGAVTHTIDAGVRFHHDYVDRHHKVRAYEVENAQLAFDGVTDRTPKALNRAETDALAVFLNDKIQIADLTINVGVRFEAIQGQFDDALQDDASERLRERDQNVVAPGLGVHYQVTDELGILAGAYKGFSPAGPSSDDSVDPEEAVNYEYGLRYQDSEFSVEAIGFFSDYSNLIGRCRASDSGCITGDEFNGGEVEVSGLEFSSAYQFALSNALSMPVQFTYTYTESAFQSDFESSFSQWGSVSRGDELPYLPEHQWRLQLGLEAEKWSVTMAAKFVDEMREIPGQGDFPIARSTRDYTTYDFSASLDLSDAIAVQFIAENITDKQVIVSRRPFGARPNQPRIVKLGATYSF